MKTIYVIKNTPVRYPIQSTILYSFLLHYFNANDVLWGVFITLYSLLWILAFIVKLFEKKVDISDLLIKNDEKVKFVDRLKDLVKEREEKK